MAGGRGIKIGEVCKRADLEPYVLRHWESEFEMLAPKKSSGGQRAYTEDEVAIILRIKELLYDDGYTIAGARKKLREEVVDGKLQRGAATPRDDGAAREAIREARKELTELLTLLD